MKLKAVIIGTADEKAAKDKVFMARRLEMPMIRNAKTILRSIRK